VVLDADGQHDPGDIPRLVGKQRETGAHIVIGSRFGESGDTELPLYRWVGLNVINLLTNASAGAFRSDERISDTQSGFRAYSAAAVDSLAASADALDDRMGASVDILHHAHANVFAVAEVPTTIRYNVSNANTRNPVSHGLSVVNSILTTLEHQRPVTVIGVPGFLMAIVGIAVGYWTLSQFLASGSFPVALAVVSAVLVLVGVFSSFTSIVLHSLNTHFDRTP